MKSLNEREDAVLAEWGYTAEEIDLIRNFNGTESGIEPVVNFNSGVKTLATASGMIVPTVIR